MGADTTRETILYLCVMARFGYLGNLGPPALAQHPTYHFNSFILLEIYIGAAEPSSEPIELAELVADSLASAKLGSCKTLHRVAFSRSYEP